MHSKVVTCMNNNNENIFILDLRMMLEFVS